MNMGVTIQIWASKHTQRHSALKGRLVIAPSKINEHKTLNGKTNTMSIHTSQSKYELANIYTQTLTCPEKSNSFIPT